MTSFDAVRSSISNTSDPSSSQTNSGSPADKLGNEQTFLKLLVAQLQNQDPLQPSDGTQFVAQLAQFSELSNTTQMAADIAAIKTALTAQKTTGS